MDIGAGSMLKGGAVVFDAIGGKSWKLSYSTLRAGGVFMVYGFSSITKNSPFSGLLSVFGDTKGVMGYNIRAFTESRPEDFRNDMEVLFFLLKAKRIQPLIGRVLPLSQAKQAHELMGAYAVEGKIVLRVSA